MQGCSKSSHERGAADYYSESRQCESGVKIEPRRKKARVLFGYIGRPGHYSERGLMTAFFAGMLYFLETTNFTTSLHLQQYSEECSKVKAYATEVRLTSNTKTVIAAKFNQLTVLKMMSSGQTWRAVKKGLLQPSSTT
jgi:hypothetical protein